MSFAYEKVEAALLAAVPTGKALVWIVVTGATLFLAGIGFDRSSAEFAAMPSEHDLMAAAIESNTVAIGDLRQAHIEMDADREQILCLVTLGALNQAFTPLQVRERCP